MTHEGSPVFWQGAVKDLSASATAFPYRSALFNAKLRTAWTDPADAAACINWVDG